MHERATHEPLIVLSPIMRSRQLSFWPISVVCLGTHSPPSLQVRGSPTLPGGRTPAIYSSRASIRVYSGELQPCKFTTHEGIRVIGDFQFMAEFNKLDII